MFHHLTVKCGFFRNAVECFSAIALITGILIVFLTPPIRSPDEGGHFVRAYEFATQGFASIWNAELSVPMRAFVAKDYTRWSDMVPSHSGRERQKYELKDFVENNQVNADNESDISVPLAHPQAIMFPLGYLPQASAIALANLFNAPFLALLYSARLLNLVVCLIATICAIRIAPDYAKTPLIAVNLLPMTVYLRSQISVDGLLLAATGFTLAVLLRLYEKYKDENTTGLFSLHILLAIGLFFIAATKSTYLIIFAFWLLIPKHNHRDWLAGIAAVLPAIILTLAWGHFLGQHDYAIHGGQAGLLDPTDKIALLQNDPLEVLARIIRSLWRNIFKWSGQMIGIFGWMDIELFVAWCFAGIFWLAGLVWIQKCNANILPKLPSYALIAVFAAQVFFVLLTIFIIWADPASPYIGGIQGRYFLPLLPCLLIGLGQFPLKKPIVLRATYHNLLLFGPALVLLLVCLATIANAEW